jgi:hypothetical protein
MDGAMANILSLSTKTIKQIQGLSVVADQHDFIVGLIVDLG